MFNRKCKNKMVEIAKWCSPTEIYEKRMSHAEIMIHIQYVIYKKQVCVPACMNVLLFATFWLTNYWVRVSLVGMVMIRARMGKFSPRGLYSSQVLCPTKCYKNASTKGCGTPGGSSTSVDKKNSWLKSGIANCASNTADYTCKKNDKCYF